MKKKNILKFRKIFLEKNPVEIIGRITGLEESLEKTPGEIFS